jgi:hypothetical protein
MLNQGFKGLTLDGQAAPSLYILSSFTVGLALRVTR